MNYNIAVVGVDTDAQHSINQFFRGQKVQPIELSYILSDKIMAQSATFDLVVLDMPPIRSVRDSERLFQWVKAWRHIPIVVLIQPSDVRLTIPLLDAGIDNYLVKPFSVEELWAKVHALLRRLKPTSMPGETHRTIEIGGFQIDIVARRVFIDDGDIHLTRKEFLLLKDLATHMDSIRMHEELLATVWGGEYGNANHYLHIYLGRIRKKLGPVYASLIETIPSMGYMLHSRLGTAQ